MKENNQQENFSDINKILPILNKISIFGGLSPDELYKVFKELKQIKCKLGDNIFRQGDEPSYIYIIISGKVKIFVEGNEIPLELFTFGVGECFGETSVIGIQAHSVTAMAVEDVDLIVLSRETLLSFFETDKNLFGMLMLNIAREACRRLHQADQTLLHYVSEEKER